MSNKRIWMPKEYKTKEIILFHLPIIKRPITKRQAIYIAVSIPIAISIFATIVRIIKPNDLETWIPIYIFAFSIPIFFAILSQKQNNGIYIEQSLKTKIKHKRSSGIMLNKKALAAIKERGEK